MSNSTAGIYDPIVQSQASKEITANNYFDAVSPANLFGRRAAICSGLTWGVYGGTIMVDGTPTQVYLSSSNTIALTASTTNYVEATRAGVVSKNTTGFTPGSIPLYTVVTGASTVTSWTDYRAWATPLNMTSKAAGVAVTTADVTLSAVQARCRYYPVTGVLTGNRALIVPNDWEGIIYNGCTGAFTLTVKTAAGTGIVVAQTMRAVLFADGTNVVRVSADV